MNSVLKVVALKNAHAKTWRDKSQLYWALGLLEEVVELIGALLRLHRGPVEWELMQISAICMNWLEMRETAMSSNKCVQRTCAESPYGTHQFMSNDPLAICVFCGANR